MIDIKWAIRTMKMRTTPALPAGKLMIFPRFLSLPSHSTLATTNRCSLEHIPCRCTLPGCCVTFPARSPVCSIVTSTGCDICLCTVCLCCFSEPQTHLCFTMNTPFSFLPSLCVDPRLSEQHCCYGDRVRELGEEDGNVPTPLKDAV